MEIEPSKKSMFGWPFWLLLSAGMFAVVLLVQKVMEAEKPRPKAQQAACITNLKQIDGAVQGWALYANKSPTDAYSLSDTDILRFLKGSVLPACPAGGVYHAGRTVTNVPYCNIPATRFKLSATHAPCCASATIITNWSVSIAASRSR